MASTTNIHVTALDGVVNMNSSSPSPSSSASPPPPRRPEQPRGPHCDAAPPLPSASLFSRSSPSAAS
ncbi:unnamed protein product [Thlaspi arvense]|uniref:Uncharacterized protein n=1 Tax=Thlaspi arvense TaxID=13288 RepID=A0AAU9SFZ9_THLAR|nr:unnamed protein product [Thlaspi arvense]